MDTCIFLGSNMILDGYFVKPGPPPLAHPSDVERFESDRAQGEIRVLLTL